MSRCVLSPFSLLSPGPPNIPTDGVEVRQVHRAGTNVRLQCPAQGDPAPILDWEKDGEAIHAGWERFKVGHSALRIKSLAEDDSGKYTCKATNGFGSAELEYWLYVYREFAITYTTALIMTSAGERSSEVRVDGLHTLSVFHFWNAIANIPLEGCHRHN